MEFPTEDHISLGRLYIALNQLQDEIKKWENYNFPETVDYEQLIGVMEELGELSHFWLKRRQGIREGVDKYQNKEKIEDHIKDAIGDITIFLINFCNHNGYSFGDCLLDTWDKVKQRDWIKFPINGRDT